MKNMTFIAYAVEKNILNGCIILADYVWKPENESEVFYDFCLTLFKEIFEDYQKQYNETETLLDAIQEIVYVSRTMEYHARLEGEKENEKRQASASVFD